jgi:hypothetical protein
MIRRCSSFRPSPLLRTDGSPFRASVEPNPEPSVPPPDASTVASSAYSDFRSGSGRRGGVEALRYEPHPQDDLLERDGGSHELRLTCDSE